MPDEQHESQTPGLTAGSAENAIENQPKAEADIDTTPNVEESLRRAELTAMEHHDAWLRAKAEADNIRKRAQIDIASAHKYAIDNFSQAMLPVKDALEAALAIENATLENTKSGVELTLKQLSSVFERFNITEINPLNDKFDPHKHQAITTAESDAPANTVLQVLQKGYSLNDRVIRPALVIVAKAKGA